MESEASGYSRFFSPGSSNDDQIESPKYKLNISDICDVLAEYQKIRNSGDVRNALSSFVLDILNNEKNKSVHNSRAIYNWRDSVTLITCKMKDGSFKESNGFLIINGFIIVPSEILFLDGALATEVHATIFNIEKETKIFKAEIAGYDKNFGFAVLKLENFRDHPHLAWGDSKCLSPGSTVAIIGKNGFCDNSINFNYVSTQRYIDTQIKGDLILLGKSDNIEIGSPIITEKGVVGMIISNKNSLVGLAEISMRKAARGIIKCYVAGMVDEKYASLISKNEYGIYESKSLSIGIEVRKVQSSDLIGTQYNTLVGYIVTKDVEIDNVKLLTGDLITHFEGRPIGDRIGQSNPFMLCSYKKEIEMTYRKISDEYSIEYLNKIKLLCEDIKLL